MDALQLWLWLLLLAALLLRGTGRVELTYEEALPVLAMAAVALVQRLLRDQVTLEDPLLAPVLLAIPTSVALARGARRGLAAAVGGWLGVALVAGTVSVRPTGPLPQEVFALATVLATVLAGAASVLRGAAKEPLAGALGPLLSYGWAAFFASRNPSYLRAGSVHAVLLLAVAHTALLTRWLAWREERARADA